MQNAYAAVHWGPAERRNIGILDQSTGAGGVIDDTVHIVAFFVSPITVLHACMIVVVLSNLRKMLISPEQSQHFLQSVSQITHSQFHIDWKHFCWDFKNIKINIIGCYTV